MLYRNAGHAINEKAYLYGLETPSTVLLGTKTRCYTFPSK